MRLDPLLSAEYRTNHSSLVLQNGGRSEDTSISPLQFGRSRSWQYSALSDSRHSHRASSRYTFVEETLPRGVQQATIAWLLSIVTKLRSKTYSRLFLRRPSVRHGLTDRELRLQTDSATSSWDSARDNRRNLFRIPFLSPIARMVCSLSRYCRYCCPLEGKIRGR